MPAVRVIGLDHVVLRCADIDLFPAPPDAHFPDSQRASGLYGAQGLASSLYVHDPDGNLVELRSYS